MSEAAALQTQTTKAQPGNSHSLLAQRKCACGGASGLTGSCSDCEKKTLLGKLLQTKLRANERSDQYEQEADRVAEQVMRMVEPAKDTNTSKTATAPMVQRKVHGDSGGIGSAPPIVHEVLASPGQPLDRATRAYFEPRFGHDFSRVRIHSDAEAEQSAKAVGALAFTVGQNIVFGLGRYAPNSVPGRNLLAHELSHVVQQDSVDTDTFVQRATGADPAPADTIKPASLAPEMSATHEIVIAGQPFGLLVITSAESIAGMHASVRESAEAYLGDYPNLAGSLWAFVVQQQDGVFCKIGGNCLGWASGTFGNNDPPEYVWNLLPQYLESIGQRTRGTPLETYNKQARAGKISPHSIWDYFMSVKFSASPANSEGEAHLAFYGRGFAGPMDGPSHIAFRTAGGEFWVSKPSATRFPVIHSQSGQMSGGQMGDTVRLYKRESGPLDHVVVTSKQVQPQ